MDLNGLLIGGLGGLGIGSILANLVSYITGRRSVIKDRLYNEKREAYLGLLSALHVAAVEPSDEHSKDFALWQTRCELFGSHDVVRHAQRIVDTNDSPREERNAAFRDLLDSMRGDLNR